MNYFNLLRYTFILEILVLLAANGHYCIKCKYEVYLNLTKIHVVSLLLLKDMTIKSHMYSALSFLFNQRRWYWNIVKVYLLLFPLLNSLLLDNERWKQADVPAEFQDLVDSISGGKIALPEKKSGGMCILSHTLFWFYTVYSFYRNA